MDEIRFRFETTSHFISFLQTRKKARPKAWIGGHQLSFQTNGRSPAELLPVFGLETKASWPQPPSWPPTESLSAAGCSQTFIRLNGLESNPSLFTSNVVVALFSQTKRPKLATWRYTKDTTKAGSSFKISHGGQLALPHDLLVNMP